jgi:hypothetical protein
MERPGTVITTDWNSTYDTLEALEGRAIRREPILREVLSPKEWAPLHHLSFATRGISIVTMMFFAGLRTSGSGIALVPAPAQELVRTWAVKVDPDHTAFIIARMVAAAHCASMEGVLPAIGNKWIDQAVVDRVARAHGKGFTTDRQDLIERLVPSGKNGGTIWLRHVAEVFDLEAPLPSALKESLVDLVAFRNAVIHPKRWDIVGAGPDAEMRARIGCWNFSVMILAGLAMESIAKSKSPGLTLPP